MKCLQPHEYQNCISQTPALPALLSLIPCLLSGFSDRLAALTAQIPEARPCSMPNRRQLLGIIPQHVHGAEYLRECRSLASSQAHMYYRPHLSSTLPLPVLCPFLFVERIPITKNQLATTPNQQQHFPRVLIYHEKQWSLSAPPVRYLNCLG